MISKTYEPKQVEEKLTKKWHSEKLFSGRIPKNKAKKPFVMVIPPPNITGALHMGHALNNTIQDALIRFHKMQGKQSYWVPGTDHGGIATQNVIEKKLSKEEKTTRHHLGREKFLQYAWGWYKECGNTILGQLKKLGCALDLDSKNVRFTMDEKRAESVFEAFKKLWNKKYIYRGTRMINWCVRCTTALSDIEVEHEEFNAGLYYIHYPLEDGSNGVIIATTRPETMFGDTAVAVNPKDERYSGLIGKKLRLPLSDRFIPVIADDEIDIKFGTGALKVTPAHDPTDYEIGKRHNLELLNTITSEGKMFNVPKKYESLTRTECRKQVICDLKTSGFLQKEKPHRHSVGTCYRCHQPIEPSVSEQWFVKMKELAAPAIEAVNKNKLKLHPPSWKKPFSNWLKNIEDWCISRQIWWGHRIPVWYCKNCSKDGLIFRQISDGSSELARVSFEKGAKPVISFEKPKECPNCKGKNLIQDPDVLDTWFSSALWPFSVFGWPEKNKEFDYFYPTSVLSTGYEILYLWVARMVMAGLEFTGKLPFSDVYLHGIVRDKTGKKMSKSLGNVVDPVDLINKYGTDAIRFSLLSQAYAGKDIPFSEDSITGARNFCNKIYNASRFVLINLPKEPKVLKVPSKFTNLADKWIIERYNTAVSKSAKDMEHFSMAESCNTLYHFLWGYFCDWYLELAKPRLETDDKENTLAVLVHILYGTLKALHPIMPFITEELAQSLMPYIGKKEGFLIEDSFPVPYQKTLTKKDALEMDAIMGIVTKIRTIRSHYNITVKTDAVITSDDNSADILKAHNEYIKLLARIDKLELGSGLPKPELKSAAAVYKNIKIYIPLEGIVDFKKEEERLLKEEEKTLKIKQHYSNQLGNSNFINNAPKEQIEKVKEKLAEAESKLKEITISLKDIR